MLCGNTGRSISGNIALAFVGYIFEVSRSRAALPLGTSGAVAASETNRSDASIVRLVSTGVAVAKAGIGCRASLKVRLNDGCLTGVWLGTAVLIASPGGCDDKPPASRACNRNGLGLGGADGAPIESLADGYICVVNGLASDPAVSGRAELGRSVRSRCCWNSMPRRSRMPTI
jgi:hypothetical protein